MTKIRIIYKSGTVFDCRCKEMTVHRNGATITRVSWVDIKPKPLHLGVDDIAAIWEM